MIQPFARIGDARGCSYLLGSSSRNSFADEVGLVVETSVSNRTVVLFRELDLGGVFEEAIQDNSHLRTCQRVADTRMSAAAESEVFFDPRPIPFECIWIRCHHA